MREIEFRGKRPDAGKWVYGSGLMVDNADLGYPVYVYSDDRFKTYKIDPKTLGQYTGLVDKNGVKIFEGDIVEKNFRLSRAYGEIVFFQGMFSVFYHDNDGNPWGNSIRVLSIWKELCKFQQGHGWFKVAGNIHDNPELLAAPDAAE